METDIWTLYVPAAMAPLFIGAWLDHRQRSKTYRAIEASTADGFLLQAPWPSVFGPIGILTSLAVSRLIDAELEWPISELEVSGLEVLILMIWAVAIALTVRQYAIYRLTPRIEGERDGLVRRDAWGSEERYPWAALERIDLEAASVGECLTAADSDLRTRHRISLQFVGRGQLVVPLSLAGQAALQERLARASLQDGVPIRVQDARRGPRRGLVLDPWRRSMP